MFLMMHWSRLRVVRRGVPSPHFVGAQGVSYLELAIADSKPTPTWVLATIGWLFIGNRIFSCGGQVKVHPTLGVHAQIVG